MTNHFFIRIKNHAAAAVIGILLLFSSPFAQVQQSAEQTAAKQTAQTAAKQTFATLPDGVRIAIQEYANPNGAEIVFIHGLLGSHLDWMKQVDDSLLGKYRLITYDLRGHGLSGKPVDAAYYTDGKRWGDDLRTVIAAAGLKRPVLVGWSLGGVVMTNYLSAFSDKDTAGLVFVDAVIELKPDLLKSHPETTKAMLSTDLETYLEGTRQFLRQCFYIQTDANTFELLYGNAAMASPEMTRAAFSGISVPTQTTLPKITVPVLLIQGENDDLVLRKMVERGQKLMPKAETLFYVDAGHAPFLEQSERFNRDLDNFVSAASKKERKAAVINNVQQMTLATQFAER